MSDTSTEAELSEAEAQEFRARCDNFLEAHATGIRLGRDVDPRGALALEAAQKFQGSLAEAGLAGLTFPTEYGGAGLTKTHERIWREASSNYPLMTSELTISHGMCLPMLAEYGSDEQKKRFLAKNISAEEVWCQMFSEPGAGSDVASLQTRAVRDGDEFVLNGQKVWTTLAHVCDYGIVLARTNPDAVKHRGISMFIVDMRDPGVEIRPIIQIDGGQHFNEVFFTDLRIPAAWLVGPENEGWRLGTSMLMYERVAIGSGATSGVAHPAADALISLATERGSVTDPVVRQQIMRLYCAETVRSLVSMRTRAEMKAGKTPGPGGSLGKLAGAIIVELAREISLEIAGPSSVAWDDPKGARWSQNVLTGFQASIAGGTNEIQRNIIGERVLGLPREPSADKDTPFKDLLVGTQS